MKLKVKIRSEEALKEISNKIGKTLSSYTREINIYTKVEKRGKVPKFYKSEEEFFYDEILEKLKIPPYLSKELIEFKYVIIFEGKPEDLSKIFNQKISEKTQYINHPFLERKDVLKVVYNPKIKHKYPIYIVSKGRWDCSLTALNFLKMGITDFKIVVEPQEYEMYNKYFEEDNLIKMDMSYKEKYETLDEYGTTKPVGPGATRNFVWDLAKKEGHKFYWVFDDNIKFFRALFENEEVFVMDDSILYYTEKIIESFDNIYMAGLNYYSFLPRKSKVPPYYKNSRIYSMILLKTDIPYRWRGRYNEDTILSLDILKDGHMTLNSNFFNGKKEKTQLLPGGNTEIFYVKEGTLPKSMMLCDVYPEYSKLKYKLGRWHHLVDYIPFKENKAGNFVGTPLTKEELWKFDEFKDKYERTDEKIIFYEKFLGIPVENKEDILRKQERYQKALKEYERDWKTNFNETYKSEYIVTPIKKSAAVIGQKREFNEKEYNLYKNKLNEVCKKNDINLFYNIIDEFLWEDIAHFVFNFGYNMRDVTDKNILKKEKLDYIITIDNVEIPEYLKGIPNLKINLKEIW